MKKSRGLPQFVFVLLGLLGLAMLLLSVGKSDDQAKPAADSYEPSGLRAFAELIKRQGYEPIVDRSSHPAIRPGDVVITFRAPEALTVGDQEPESDPEAKVYSRVRDSVKRGATLIETSLPKDFNSASKSLVGAKPTVVKSVATGEQLNVIGFTGDSRAVVEGTTLWRTTTGQQDPVVTVSSIESGKIVELSNGIALTNRFIDKADNARLAMSAIQLVSKNGGRVIFAEAAWSGAVDKGFFAAMGNWALMGYYQALLILLLVLAIAGKRFGFPDETRVKSSGARSLTDAVSFVMRRGKHAKLALQAAEERLNRDVRLALRLPVDASEQEVDRLIPEDLKLSLKSIRVALNEKSLNSERAVQLVISAQDQLGEFARSRQPR